MPVGTYVAVNECDPIVRLLAGIVTLESPEELTAAEPSEVAPSAKLTDPVGIVAVRPEVVSAMCAVSVTAVLVAPADALGEVIVVEVVSFVTTTGYTTLHVEPVTWISTEKYLADGVMAFNDGVLNRNWYRPAYEPERVLLNAAM